MKLFAVLILMCISVFAETQVVEWSLSPKRTACFAVKIAGKDVKFVGMEWAEFVKKYEYCYIKGWLGWSKVKTADADKSSSWEWPSSYGNAQWPLHIPPYRNGGSDLIIVTPTISADPHQK